MYDPYGNTYPALSVVEVARRADLSLERSRERRADTVARERTRTRLAAAVAAALWALVVYLAAGGSAWPIP